MSPQAASVVYIYDGDDGIRTPDPLLARQVLSQLSYTPIGFSDLFSLSMSYPSLKIEQQSVPRSYHRTSCASCAVLLRKEVIQPHLPIRLPCYDFTPITSFTFGGVLLAVRLPTSGPPGSHGVTGGVYKARERIHRGMLIRDY